MINGPVLYSSSIHSIQTTPCSERLDEKQCEPGNCYRFPQGTPRIYLVLYSCTAPPTSPPPPCHLPFHTRSGESSDNLSVRFLWREHTCVFDHMYMPAPPRAHAHAQQAKPKSHHSGDLLVCLVARGWDVRLIAHVAGRARVFVRHP